MFFDPEQASIDNESSNQFYSKQIIKREIGWWEDELRGNDPLWRKACRSIAKFSFETLPDDSDLELWTCKFKYRDSSYDQMMEEKSKRAVVGSLYGVGTMYNSRRFTGSSGPR